MITTNLSNRCSLLENTIKSINNCDNIFSEKILSVDVFQNTECVSNTWFDKFKNDWSVYFKNKSMRNSMILNQQNSIKNANNDIIMYSEDDIIVNKIPKLDTIDKLFNSNFVNDKQVGFICYNNHVWVNFNENPKHIIDFINNVDNYIIINDDVFLVKNKMIRDNYYLNFPVSITRKKLFLDIQNHCFSGSYRGKGVETAMSNAWFEMAMDKKYEVLIYLKNEIIDDIKSGKKISVLDFYNYANMNFWNNDINLRHKSIDNRINTTF